MKRDITCDNPLEPRLPEPTGRPKAEAPLPEFGRWRDVERLFGIKRGTLYRLIAEGKIRSITLRQPGRKFGCRLIHLQSVSEYYNLVEIMADPKHPEHAEMTEWVGGELKPEGFSVEGVNKVFRRLKA